MKHALQEILKLKAFLITSLMFIVLGIILLATTNKVEFHLWMNSLHSDFLDPIFKYGTHLGDGLFIAIAVLPVGLLAFRKYKFAGFFLGWLTMFFVGLLAQFLKRGVFPNAERPFKYIGEDLLYLVPGVEMHSMNSFPSGHTTGAFAFFAFVSMVLFKKQPALQVLMALLAGFAGYSRIYLSQHFLEDVVTGAAVGLFAFFLGQLATSLIFRRQLS